ncbi:MAG TPA: nuclear transport factor 2 family protein [Paucimonas sp.]|nr:nuclear transport factor 2 family protein [Paucimonas sp.]
MRRRHFLQAAAITNAGMSAAPAAASASADALDALIRDYERRTNSHRFDEVAEVLAANAEFQFGGKAHRGLTEVRAYFEGTWAKLPDERYAIENVRWIAIGADTAACVYDYRWQGTYQGKPQQGGGYGTNVLVHIDGRWKIVHEHLSAVPNKP